MSDGYPRVTNPEKIILLKKLQYTDHLMFLYTPDVNVNIFESFLTLGIDNGRLTTYISAGYTDKNIRKQINSIIPKEKCEIAFASNSIERIRNNIKDLLKGAKCKYKSGLNLVVNYEQIPSTCNSREIIMCERYIHEQEMGFPLFSISAFDSTVMTHELLECLIPLYEKVIISTGNKSTTLMYTNGKSSKTPIDITSREVLEHEIKNNLETLIFSMLNHKGMCGYDIIKTIQRRFQVEISPGTIYPILHSLKRAGIIEQSKSSNRKVYLPTKEGEGIIQKDIHDFLAAKEYLSNFIAGGG